MSEKNTKAVRKEVRELVKEMLPGAIHAEHHEALMAVINKRLTALEAKVKETLDKLEEDHKNTMSYLVRNLTSGNTGPKQ